MSSKASSTDPAIEAGGGAAFAPFLAAVLDLALPAGTSVVVLPSIGSTNALGRRVAGEYFRDNGEPPRSLYVAWRQEDGRGRRGSAWASPAGHGVYASLLLPVSGETGLHTVPLLAAVGLCKAIQAHLPPAEPSCRLKWPNDLLLGDRKLGGLLIEAVSGEGDERALVIGFGINHTPCARVREAIGEGAGQWNAVALTEVAPQAPPLAGLLGELVTALCGELERRDDEPYARRAYEALSMHQPGDRIRCRDGRRTVSGEFLGFDLHGFLRLRVASGEEMRLAAGEVLA